MVRGNDGLEPLAADIDLHGVIREDVAVDVAQADGALAVSSVMTVCRPSPSAT